MTDLVGSVFGRLTVRGLAPRQNGRVRWVCDCICGGKALVQTSNLTSGRQRSCGCLAAEVRRARIERQRKPLELKRKAHRRRTRRWARKTSAERYAKMKADPQKWADTLRRAREWAARNKGHKNAMTRNRRARLRGAEGTHTWRDVAGLLVAQAGVCAMCPEEIILNFHVDHIVPVSKGGRNDVSNLQLLCPPCNMSKSDKVFI